MKPVISVVTLGVADVLRAKAFYERLGFVASSASSGSDVAFFQLGHLVLGLFGRQALAHDATIADTPVGFAGVSIGHNVHSESEVDAVLAEAVRAGAKLVKPGQKTFWGGYSGYFSDPDGFLWEVTHAPGFKLAADGTLTMP